MNLDDMRSIIIADDGVSNLYIKVNYLPSEQEWKIVNLEYYATFEGAHAGEECGRHEIIADDVSFEHLPHTTKLAIWAKLDAVVKRRREAAKRVLEMRQHLTEVAT